MKGGKIIRTRKYEIIKTNFIIFISILIVLSGSLFDIKDFKPEMESGRGAAYAAGLYLNNDIPGSFGTQGASSELLKENVLDNQDFYEFIDIAVINVIFKTGYKYCFCHRKKIRIVAPYKIEGLLRY